LENVASFGRYVTLTLQLEQHADNLSEAQRRRLETERDIALDRSYLLAQKALMRNATEALNNIENHIAASSMTSKTLVEHHQTVRQIEKELETLAGELAARVEVYEKERYLLRKRLNAAAGENREMFRVAAKMNDNLLTELQQLQSELDQQQNRADTVAQRLSAHHAEVRRKELFERRPFLWGTEYWATLSDNLAKAPALVYYQMQISLSAIFNAVTRLGFRDWSIVITLETGLFLALIAFRYGLGRLERRLRTQSATPAVSRIVWMLRQLLQMNLLGIGLLLALFPLSWMMVIVPPSEELVLMLVSVVVVTKLANNLAWLLLNHPDLPSKSRYPKVYWALCLTLWSGGLLIILTALGYLSDLPIILLSALDRLFMLYLLLTALPVFWFLRVVRQRLLNYYGRRYWVNIVRLASVVIPIFQLLIGLAGVSGYLNLAWAGARQLLAFIAVLLGWLLSQQLLNDVAAALKQRAFDNSREVWLATRRVVEPLQRVLGLSLLLTAIYLLISLYSLDDVIAEAWLVLMAAVITVVVLYEILFWLADYSAEKSQGKFIRRLIDKARTPLGLILPVAAAQITLPLLELPEKLIALGGHALTLLQIAAVTWFFLRLISLLDQVSESRYKRSEVKEDLVVRRARTQLRVLRQALHLTVVLIGIGAMLMTFPGIRQFGAGLLASAGAAGIVIGIAARPLFENLIAGIQIALTQPIRLDDVVIVEGEWGTIEEINATYVVVQIWDDRRLVVPLNYFNENPFQHWSRKGTELLGSVFLSVDYSFPVEEGRKALKRILEETDLWDGRAWVLQVTDLKGYTMELRALATARDAPTAWDLRCYVREKLIEFIQQNYPASLPQLRTRPAEDEEKAAEQAAPPFIIQPHEQGLA
jgi:small-conductance mechanosensitive channel